MYMRARSKEKYRSDASQSPEGQIEEIKEINDTAPKNIPIESILELRNKGLSLSQVGKVLGCSSVNVSNRLKQYQPTFERLEHFKKNTSDIFTLKLSEVINALTLDEIKKASPQVKGMLIGILYDKLRLEKGLSTQNISVFSRIVEQACTEDAKPADKQSEADSNKG